MQEVIKGSVALCEAAMFGGLVTDKGVTGFLALAVSICALAEGSCRPAAIALGAPRNEPKLKSAAIG